MSKREQFIRPVGNMMRGDIFTLLEDRATRENSTPAGIIPAGTECVVVGIHGPYLCVDDQGHEILLERDILVDYQLGESNTDVLNIKLSKWESDWLWDSILWDLETNEDDWDQDDLDGYHEFRRKMIILYNKVKYWNW